MHFYSTSINEPVYKIGCSIDVGRRIRDGDYVTAFWEEYQPVYLGSVHPHGYETFKEILFLEQLIHHHFDRQRPRKNRELFFNVTLKDVSDYLKSLGINHNIILERPDPIYERKLLDKKEKLCLSFKDIIEGELKMDKKKEIVENKVSVINGLNLNIDFSLFSNGEIKKESPIKPLSFQKEMIDKLYNHYMAGNSKGTMLAACGIGKSFIALFLIEKMNINLSVIFVPTIILSAQFEKHAREILIDHDVIRFCSEINKSKNKELIINNIKNNKKMVIICTYDSYYDTNWQNPERRDELYNILQKINRYPDMMIVDEAHNTCINKSISENSDRRNIISLPCKYSLFMTATMKVIGPKISKVKDENKNQDVREDIENKKEIDDDIDDDIDEYISMDNEEHYGKIVVNMNFSEAIERGLISDYRFVVVNSGDPIEVISKVIKELNIKHMITYHNLNINASDLTDRLNKANIPSFTINGIMSQNQRNDVLKRFEGTTGSVLTSCQVLSEGISLNYVDCVYFVDKRESEINNTQSTSRCLRLHEGKTLATIVIENNIKKYAEILKNISFIDKRVKGNRNRMFVNIGFNNEEIIKIKQDVDYVVVGRNEINWYEKYALCRDYENLNPDKIITGRIEHGDNQVAIGMWIDRQKERYRGIGTGRKMTDPERELLLQLNTFKHWVKSPNFGLSYEHKWMKNYNISIEFEKVRQTDIKYNTEYRDVQIGCWLMYQKKKYKDSLKNGCTKYNTEKYKLLLNLYSFKNWIDRRLYLDDDEKWFSNYELCWEYENLYGVFSTNQTYKNFGIGEWVKRQKVRYKKEGVEKDAFLQEQLDLLFKLKTFKKWTDTVDLNRRVLSKEESWMISYKLCLKFESDHPNVNIRSSENYNESNIGEPDLGKSNIGKWLYRNRDFHKKGIISEERSKLLMNIRTHREWLQTLQ